MRRLSGGFVVAATLALGMARLAGQVIDCSYMWWAWPCCCLYADPRPMPEPIVEPIVPEPWMWE